MNFQAVLAGIPLGEVAPAAHALRVRCDVQRFRAVRRAQRLNVLDGHALRHLESVIAFLGQRRARKASDKFNSGIQVWVWIFSLSLILEGWPNR